LIKNKH